MSFTDQVKDAHRSVVILENKPTQAMSALEYHIYQEILNKARSDLLKAIDFCERAGLEIAIPGWTDSPKRQARPADRRAMSQAQGLTRPFGGVDEADRG